MPERIQVDGRLETQGAQGRWGEEKREAGYIPVGNTHFWRRSSEGERKDRKLTAIAARQMEVRAKEELPNCEGLGQKWSLEPGGWGDIKARES